MSDVLRFEVVTRLDIIALGAAWCDLQTRAAHEFFLEWGWISAWLSELDQTATVLVGRADETVVLLGVLVANARRGIVPVNGLHLHDTGQDALDVITIEYNGFLVDRAWQGRAEPAAIRFLLRGAPVGRHTPDELHIKGVAQPFDPAALGGGLVAEAVVRQPSWHVDLAALCASGGDYLAALSANTRYQIRRSMRLYEHRGPLSLERARDVPEGLAFLRNLKELHQSYWTSRGEVGAFGFPFFERFQRRLIAGCLAAGQVELLRLRAGAEDIGYLYNFVHEGRVLAYQSGFRYESDPRLKPGLVSHTLCVMQHMDEGARSYDLLAGAARYKASLGEPGPDMTHWRIERRTPLLMAERGLKSLRRALARHDAARVEVAKS
jgi:CelD/BcsL family acetyltransferase involved in cellulose biosynthesis